MQHLIEKHLYRERKIHDASLLDFTSNDYLHLSSHPDVKKAFLQGVEKYGLGSGSSPQVSAYTVAHQALEEAFAEFLQREKAILFNSGYHANVGTIPALVNRSSTIYADRLCHASLIDGILLSRAKHVRYPHHSTPEISGMTAIITESVFSMEGDITDLKPLSELAKKHQAILYVDDAHAVGVLGARGRGMTEYSGINKEIHCLVTPLGKALGSQGAIVSGSHDLIEHILQSARTYRYSTALPAANCIGTLAALNILQRENWRREKLNSLIQFFIKEADKRQLGLISRDLTPIKSILIGDNQRTLALQQKLRQERINVACIRPPTVPANTARLRISLHCEHEEKDIMRLLDAIR